MCVNGIIGQFSVVGVLELPENVGIVRTMDRGWRIAGGDGGGGDHHHHYHKDDITQSTSKLPNSCLSREQTSLIVTCAVGVFLPLAVWTRGITALSVDEKCDSSDNINLATLGQRKLERYF